MRTTSFKYFLILCTCLFLFAACSNDSSTLSQTTEPTESLSNVQNEDAPDDEPEAPIENTDGSITVNINGVTLQTPFTVDEFIEKTGFEEYSRSGTYTDGTNYLSLMIEDNDVYGLSSTVDNQINSECGILSDSFHFSINGITFGMTLEEAVAILGDYMYTSDEVDVSYRILDGEDDRSVQVYYFESGVELIIDVERETVFNISYIIF